MHVLLVEDDAALAESIATAMRSKGWRPDLSDRGEPVPASLLRDAYDALVLDIGLPGIDGLETLRRLREQGSALRFDSSSMRAHIGERAVQLSARECIVLQYLMVKTGSIVTRDQLSALVPGWAGATSPNSLELLISRLRAKIEAGGVRLRTVRGLGYLLEPVSAS